jgi:hypothetical protein
MPVVTGNNHMINTQRCKKIFYFPHGPSPFLKDRCIKDNRKNRKIQLTKLKQSDNINLVFSGKKGCVMDAPYRILHKYVYFSREYTSYDVLLDAMRQNFNIPPEQIRLSGTSEGYLSLQHTPFPQPYECGSTEKSIVVECHAVVTVAQVTASVNHFFSDKNPKDIIIGATSKNQIWIRVKKE